MSKELNKMDAVKQKREQLLEDIQALPDDALQRVADLIFQLRQEVESNEVDQSADQAEESAYEKLKKSGLIGCMEGPPDLSVNYKKYLAEGLAKKYGYR